MYITYHILFSCCLFRVLVSVMEIVQQIQKGRFIYSELCCTSAKYIHRLVEHHILSAMTIIFLEDRLRENTSLGISSYMNCLHCASFQSSTLQYVLLQLKQRMLQCLRGPQLDTSRQWVAVCYKPAAVTQITLSILRICPTLQYQCLDITGSYYSHRQFFAFFCSLYIDIHSDAHLQ